MRFAPGLIGFLVALTLVTPATPTLAQTGIVLQPVITSVPTPPARSPVGLVNAGDGSGRLFLLIQQGEILVLSGGAVQSPAFLDIRSDVLCCGERGLLGVAFHPQFESNGFFWVYYTDLTGANVLARFQASPPSSGVVNPATRRILFSDTQPGSNHNGGQLAFGPDGFLYVSKGDGGDAGQRAEPVDPARKDPAHPAEPRRVRALLHRARLEPIRGHAGRRPGDLGLRPPQHVAVHLRPAHRRHVPRRRRRDLARGGELPARRRRGRQELRLAQDGRHALRQPAHQLQSHGGVRRAHPRVRARRGQLLHHRRLPLPRGRLPVPRRHLLLRRLLHRPHLGGDRVRRKLDDAGAARHHLRHPQLR